MRNVGASLQLALPRRGIGTQVGKRTTGRLNGVSLLASCKLAATTTCRCEFVGKLQTCRHKRLLAHVLEDGVELFLANGESFEKDGVELAAGAFEDEAAGLGVRQGGFVEALAAQRVVDVGD